MGYEIHALIGGIIIGGVAVWLALRNNPKVMSKLDEIAKIVENLKR